MGAWNTAVAKRGDGGGGDKSFWKDPFCVHNDLNPGKG